MKKKRVKIAVTGAAGQIGYAILFRIASGQMYGADTEVELRLLELEAALPALEGVVMELEDCAFPLLKSISYTSDLNTVMTGVNWAILIGSVPRKQGMERSDLLSVNGNIFTAQGKAINDHAADNVRVFVVGNPCNTNCLIALNNAPDVPEERFYAMTMLDELRAKAQLAKKAKTGVQAVTDMVIWGNHSATQYPDFYNAKINGSAVPDLIADETWLQNDFIQTIQQRGAAVIKARGASSAASAANAAINGVHNLVTETQTNDCYSMATLSHGEYGVDEGLIYSFPCRTENGVVHIVENIVHNDFAREKLQATLTELRQERDTVKALGLIK